MRKPLQILLFFLAFQMEVRVRASNTASSELLTEPSHCLGVSAPCAFKVPSENPWSTAEGRMKITATPRSILSEEVRHKEWRLIDGAMWVRNAPSLKIKTASAEVDASSGEYWILAKQGRIVFRNISSKLIVTFKDQSTLEVPRGFEVWAEGVDSNARVLHGMVEPIRLKEHLKIWFSLYAGSKKEFLSEVQDLKDQWVDLVEKSGDMYQKVAERRLAAIENEKIQKAASEKKRQEANAKLRQRFYEKVFQQ
jgi:hypothetical protein